MVYSKTVCHKVGTSMDYLISTTGNSYRKEVMGDSTRSSAKTTAKAQKMTTRLSTAPRDAKPVSWWAAIAFPGLCRIRGYPRKRHRRERRPPARFLFPTCQNEVHQLERRYPQRHTLSLSESATVNSPSGSAQTKWCPPSMFKTIPVVKSLSKRKRYANAMS